MPYARGNRLPGERASKLGHLEVLKSELVKEIIGSFETPELENFEINTDSENYSFFNIDEIVDESTRDLPIVFGIDGSIQTINSIHNKRRELSFIKTALLRVDGYALSKVDKNNPHPLELRDILQDSAVYHATVIPLRNIRPKNMSLYDGVREIINDSMNDPSLEGEIYETLKWLIFEKWGEGKQISEKFQCPFCGEVAAVIERDKEFGVCQACHKHTFITDFLGFHVEMEEDFAAGTVASSYMLIHETLLTLTAIRIYWETNRQILNECLFVKDGGLFIRAHYSKIVAPIRRFLQYAADSGTPIYFIGQEKSGSFVDYLGQIKTKLPKNCIIIPKNNYIKHNILSRANHGGPYGRTSNFGAKVLIKLDTHHLVLSIPTGKYTKDPELENLIGIDRILKTIPKLLSFRFEDALLPIELANGIASLSTYPSAKILQLFTEDISK